MIKTKFKKNVELKVYECSVNGMGAEVGQETPDCTP